MSKGNKINNVTASNHFIKFKKGCNAKLQLFLDTQVQTIIDDPEIGELKKVDLKGIRIHSFQYVREQLFWISYEVTGITLNLYSLGSVEA
jgi:hypothetical protein